MSRGASFWVPMAIFQIAFGLAVFAATRYYYRDAPPTTTVTAAILDRPWSALPLEAPGTGSSGVDTITENVIASGDPIEISQLADELFSAREYDGAARLYAELLRLAPDHADTYNNLGLTLHYLGRSAEALDILSRGVAAEPTHQRIWLTLGFVNSQIGDVEQARTALTNATEMGDDEDIRQSARDMLKQLP